MLDIEEPLSPILATLLKDFVKAIGPSIDVVASEKSKDDMIVEAVRRQVETIVDKPIRLPLGDRGAVWPSATSIEDTLPSDRRITSTTILNGRR